jgi:hypothetical protein
MAWYLVSSALLRQDRPHERQVLYWDGGPLHVGELALWVDAGGELVRFQLSHRPFRGRREHLVEWQRGGTLRFGEVDDGEDGRRLKRTPTIRYGPPDAAVLAVLRAYFAANAGALEPEQRATIARLLGDDPPPPPSRSPPGPRRPPLHAVSGKRGGTGKGRAATEKDG